MANKMMLTWQNKYHLAYALYQIAFTFLQETLTKYQVGPTQPTVYLPKMTLD